MAGLTYHAFVLPSQADTKQDSPVSWTAWVHSKGRNKAGRKAASREAKPY